MLPVPAHPAARRYCDACEQAVPAAGCVAVDRYTLCAGCAAEYRWAQVWAQPLSPGRYVRDKRFGDGAAYTLPADPPRRAYAVVSTRTASRR